MSKPPISSNRPPLPEKTNLYSEKNDEPITAYEGTCSPTQPRDHFRKKWYAKWGHERSEKRGVEHEKALMKGTRDEKVAKIAEQGLEIKEDLERKGMLSQRTRTSSALYLNKMAQGMDTQTLPVSYFHLFSLNNRLFIRWLSAKLTLMISGFRYTARGPNVRDIIRHTVCHIPVLSFGIRIIRFAVQF